MRPRRGPQLQKKVEEGAPGWMVTFGDLMSLLLTFFILLYSVSDIKQPKIYDLIRSIQAYWDVDAPSSGYYIQPFDEVANLLAERTYDQPDQMSARQGNTEEIVENPFGKEVAVSRVRDNLRIDIQGRVLFDEGSAVVSEPARHVLENVRKRLIGYPNRIKIVGHAAPVPLPPGSPFTDHYELGYRRAEAVMQVLVAGKNGVRKERIELCSRGDQDLLPGVDIFDPDSRARLRRVEIIITPEKAIRPQDGAREGLMGRNDGGHQPRS